jgi:superfamily II DNA or RNA helicase
MDDPLRRVSVALVRDRIARAWIDAPFVEVSLGSIRLSCHQVDAAARLERILDEFGGALLADAVGTGKTYTALAVDRAARLVTVVAPSSLRAHWTEALVRADRVARFVSFEALSRFGQRVLGPSDLVIVDEAHHARNPRTRRYDALARLVAGARVLLLSATPIHNRPGELRHQLALFLGQRAHTLGDAELARLVVRRASGTLRTDQRFPSLALTTWLPIPAQPAVLHAITDLPASVASADGGTADALLRLGLLRAWMSSDAALRAALRQRVTSGTALTEALLSGRLPTRRELSAWVLLDDAVQLAFPELVSAPHRGGDARDLLAALAAHLAGVRRVLHALDESPGNDVARAQHVQRLRERHAESRVVVFTQFVHSARALFALLGPSGGVALVTARGARIASGTVTRSEIVRRFGVRDDGGDYRTPVNLLICTDVLSEGLDLQGANVLVHLDLPWTPARLEQRVGRLRRIGSSHARVYVYGIGPPATRRALLPVIRALQRKARVIRVLGGDPDLLAQEPVLRHGRRSEARPTRRKDLTAHAEILRAVFSTWRDHAAVSAGPEFSDGECPVTAVATAGINEPWLALALVCRRGRPRVIALGPTGASEHPSIVGDVARVATHAVDLKRADDACDADAHFRAARTVLHRWFDAERGSALATPVVDRASPGHVRVLRRLTELLSDVPRHKRTGLSELISRCRGLVTSAQGVGAERVLSEWHRADEAAERTRAGTVDTRLRSLADRLASLGVTASAPARSADTSLAALLVIVRA